MRNNSVSAISQNKDNQKSKKGLPIVERVEHHDLEDRQDLVLVGPQHLHGGLATPENVNNKKLLNYDHAVSQIQIHSQV